MLIDISALEIVDSFIGRMLDNIAAVSRILDADTVVVGMRPAVAITLVELGLSLTGVKTALNVERGMAMIHESPRRVGGRRCRRRRLSVSRSGISDDVVRVRQLTRTLAVEVGLGLVDQTKIITAASELARNTLDYGGGGDVTAEIVEQGGRRGVRLTFEDKGPGIADIEQALKDGFTSGKGMGLGLGGAKRLCNEFSIDIEARRRHQSNDRTLEVMMKSVGVNDQSGVAEARRTATDLAQRVGFTEAESRQARSGRDRAFDQPHQARLGRRNSRRHL